MIIVSLLTGKTGSYSLLGMRVNFGQGKPDIQLNYNRMFFVGRIAKFCINSRVFRYVTFSYLNVFVHEMGHALAHLILTGKCSTLHVYTDTCTGEMIGKGPRPTAIWKQNIISAAGPITSVAFSSLKLIAATALSAQLTAPVACVLGAGAVAWMAGELIYAAISTLELSGDYGAINFKSKTHFCIASITLIAECALGIFLAIKLAA